MNIGFAQLNTTVGDLRGNAEQILAAYRDLVARGAQLVLTPELALTGYPPQDLVFKSRFVPRNLEMLAELHAAVGEAPLIVGCIDHNTGPGQPFHNAAAVLEAGKPIRKIHKSLLPTYDVFDEDRYFEPGSQRRPDPEISGAQIWRDDLRGHLDGEISAAPALRAFAGHRTRGAGRRGHLGI